MSIYYRFSLNLNTKEHREVIYESDRCSRLPDSNKLILTYVPDKIIQINRFISAVAPNTIQEFWFGGDSYDKRLLSVGLYAKELAKMCGRTMKYIDFNNCSFSDEDLSSIIKSTVHASQIVFWSCKFSFNSELDFNGPSFNLDLLSFQYSGKLGKFTIKLS